jgi:putative FmdB family regulatory protein
MPTYAYACERCGHEFEAFQSITARPMRKCPACGQTSLKRLIGAGAGIIFKGSGFYCTDYRSESYKTATTKDTGGGTDKGAEKNEAKTEAASAPAAKSDATQEKKSA